MTYPDTPQVIAGSRTLMIAAVPLGMQGLSGPLPGVPAGAAFWYRPDRAGDLVSGSQAHYALAGTALPRAEPPFTTHGTLGFARGSSNASP
jgi:hypothetical protein